MCEYRSYGHLITPAHQLTELRKQGSQGNISQAIGAVKDALAPKKATNSTATGTTDDDAAIKEQIKALEAQRASECGPGMTGLSIYISLTFVQSGGGDAPDRPRSEESGERGFRCAQQCQYAGNNVRPQQGPDGPRHLRHAIGQPHNRLECRAYVSG